MFGVLGQPADVSEAVELYSSVKCEPVSQAPHLVIKLTYYCEDGERAAPLDHRAQ